MLWALSPNSVRTEFPPAQNQRVPLTPSLCQRNGDGRRSAPALATSNCG